MKTAIGQGTGTGARGVSFDVGFSPKVLLIATNAAQFCTIYIQGGWCGRSNALANNHSFTEGIRVVGSTVYLGTDARVNASGVKYYWAAIGDDGSKDFEIVKWMGNATAGRTVSTQVPKQPQAVLVKRDSTRTGVVKVNGAASTAFLDGSAPSDCITLSSAGSFTVTAANEVNEYSSAGGTGEGVDSVVLYASQNSQQVSWTNGTSGQIVSTTTDPLFALICRTDGTAGIAHFVTRDMLKPDGAKPATALALATNIASLQYGGIKLGSAATVRTGGWSALVFGRNEVAEVQTPAIIIKNKKGVYFPGRGVASQVVCGNSDATLKIDGAISIEWFGAVWGESSTPGSDVTFLTRGAGPLGSAGAYSWGLGAMHKNDLGWSGHQVHGIVASRYDIAAPLDTAAWRTGVLVPNGIPTHYLMTHNGAGRWRLYVNGVLSRQRDYNLPMTSGVGHYTAFGMRPNTGGTYTNAQRMIALAGRVYNRELSMDEVVARYQIEALGSSTSADVTSGLAEKWDFSSASGTSLPSVVNAANTGVLSANCTVVTL